MPEEEKDDSVFEDAAVEEELPEDMGDGPGEEEEQGEFSPTVSSESPKERIERKGVKEKADGKTLTIKQWFFTRPKTKSIDGQKVAPKETQTSGKPFYPGKLGIRFEEDNLVEYYPTMRYFVNDGKVSAVAKLNRVQTSERASAIKKIVDLVVTKINKPIDEVSDKEILDFLIGKKVKIKTVTGKFNGKEWFRNDMIQILD